MNRIERIEAQLEGDHGPRVVLNVNDVRALLRLAKALQSDGYIYDAATDDAMTALEAPCEQ